MEILIKLQIVLPEPFQLPPQEVASLIRIGDRPDDLVQMNLQGILLQRQADLRQPSCQRLVLFDLDITEPNDILPGAFRRSSSWIPHTTTRLTLFRLFGLEHFLRDTPQFCQLWHNNALVDPDRVPPLLVEDGDYIRIFIGRSRTPSSCEDESDETVGFQYPLTSNTNEDDLFLNNVILAIESCKWGFSQHGSVTITPHNGPQSANTGPVCHSQDPPPALFGRPPPGQTNGQQFSSSSRRPKVVITCQDDMVPTCLATARSRGAAR